jgi:murein L,D-transpeptidase YafK
LLDLSCIHLYSAASFFLGPFLGQHLVRIANFSSRPFSAFVFLGLLSVAPAAFPQAGSQPPVYFDAADAGSGFAYISSGAPQAASGIVANAKQEPIYPAGALQLPSETRYLLWAELEAGRLSVLENHGDQGLSLLRHIPISIGKNGIGKEEEGDKKTPLGVYRITTFMQDQALDDYYGLGAYPIDYPNALDQIEGRTGHGIWLHGLPKSVAERPFMDSDGCVVVDNDSLLDLAREITPGLTHLVISRKPIRWVTADEQAAEKNELGGAFEAWRQAWEQRDNAAYLSFYGEDFSDLSLDKAGWSAYKTRVNDSKRFIGVEVSQVVMLENPDTPGTVDVRFYQNYRSDNYNWKGWKHQLWRQEQEGWKIVYEGNG